MAPPTSALTPRHSTQMHGKVISHESRYSISNSLNDKQVWRHEFAEGSAFGSMLMGTLHLLGKHHSSGMVVATDRPIKARLGLTHNNSSFHGSCLTLQQHKTVRVCSTLSAAGVQHEGSRTEIHHVKLPSALPSVPASAALPLATPHQVPVMTANLSSTLNTTATSEFRPSSCTDRKKRP